MISSEHNYMPINNDQKLLRFLRTFPLGIVFVFIFVLAGVMLHGNAQKVDSLITSLRVDVYDRQKEMLREQVKSIHGQLEFERMRTNKVLKDDIKQRVEEAYTIAFSIYKQNQDKPKSYVTKLISDALREVRFNDGRGYYFISQMDGVNIMHALKPELEGNSTWDAQDKRGTYIVREHVELLKQTGEAFYRWWYQKPGAQTEEFEKVGFAKYFEPYDWFIGTGEYVADVERDIQNRMLERLSEHTFGMNGYVFVINSEGKNLVHGDASHIGKDKSKYLDLFKKNIKNKPAVNGIQGAFVQYDSEYAPQGVQDKNKLSFIAEFKDWGWYFGAGVYMSQIESYLDHQESILHEQNREELIKILLLCFGLAIILSVISLRISYYIGLRFSEYQKRISKDFEALENSREKMHDLATHDALTHLPNRLLLEERIQSGIKKSKLAGQKLAVMFVDMDDFKKVNDQHGHNVGDLYLQAVSKKFERLVSGKGSVARFGGDEFIFCFPNLSNTQEAKIYANGIREVFDEQFHLDGTLLTSTCSIGVAMYPDDGSSCEELISKSDIVLYRSKDKQKGQVMFYDTEVNAQVQMSFLMQDELATALKNKELSVLYQPQLTSCTQKIMAVEALCRWTNPRLGQVSPQLFIDVAEKAGLIIDIGEFVFVQACKDILAMSPNGDDALGVSVNISPVQLMQPGFSEHIYLLAKETEIDVKRVTLELTENVLIEDLDKVKPVLIRLRQYGFSLSLDDFGTGYSSIQYLHALPICELKIDRTFINSMFEDGQNDALVKTMVGIGKSFDMLVVAEGVETHTQRERLKELKCDRLQGYYFDKPLDILTLRDKYQPVEIAEV